MPLDAYELCPCGSGKKLKFCCHAIAAEMEKVARQRENNQSRSALQTLDRLEESHPRNPWVITTKAAMLLAEERADESRRLLAQLLADQPDHLFANMLHATVAFALDGYEQSKPLIYRAFRRCVAAFPEMTASLAMGIAATLYAEHRFMAARQHLALAMRMAPEQQRQDIFVRLLDFDSNRRIPYPLRSVHQLATPAGDEDAQTRALNAKRLSDIGCFEPAADEFEKLIEHDTDNAALWQNLGLCRAWDGNESAAVDALRRAAELSPDFKLSVELLTMAALLAQNSTDDRIDVETHTYRVQSTARLLTLLDEHPRILRVEMDPESNQLPELFAGMFELMDRPLDGDIDSAALTIDTVPSVIGRLTIQDTNPQQELPAYTYLMSFEGETLEASTALLNEVAGEQLERDADVDDEDDLVIESSPRELQPMEFRWRYPTHVTGIRRDELEREKWHHLINSVWFELPLSALNGQTPRAAAEDPAAKQSLTAAVYALDAFCEQSGHLLDINGVFAQLGLSAPERTAVDERTPLNAFSAMQLHWLPIEQLNDDQLNYTLNRALLIHHTAFLFETLNQVLTRPTCVEKVDLNRTYFTMFELCDLRNERQQALMWLEKGKALAESGENAFQEKLQWELRELSYRVEDPQDPALKPLVQRLFEYYSPKVPQIVEIVTGLLVKSGCTDLLSAANVVAVGDEATAAESGGIWTPDATPDETSGEKKLWLPGQ